MLELQTAITGSRLSFYLLPRSVSHFARHDVSHCRASSARYFVFGMPFYPHYMRAASIGVAGNDVCTHVMLALYMHECTACPKPGTLNGT